MVLANKETEYHGKHILIPQRLFVILWKQMGYNILTN
jgi:hypothetical protein